MGLDVFLQHILSNNINLYKTERNIYIFFSIPVYYFSREDFNKIYDRVNNEKS